MNVDLKDSLAESVRLKLSVHHDLDEVMILERCDAGDNFHQTEQEHPQVIAQRVIHEFETHEDLTELAFTLDCQNGANLGFQHEDFILIAVVERVDKQLTWRFFAFSYATTPPIVFSEMHLVEDAGILAEVNDWLTKAQLAVKARWN